MGGDWLPQRGGDGARSVLIADDRLHRASSVIVNFGECPGWSWTVREVKFSLLG